MSGVQHSYKCVHRRSRPVSPGLTRTNCLDNTPWGVSSTPSGVLSTPSGVSSTLSCVSSTPCHVSRERPQCRSYDSVSPFLFCVAELEFSSSTPPPPFFPVLSDRVSAQHPHERCPLLIQVCAPQVSICLSKGLGAPVGSVLSDVTVSSTIKSCRKVVDTFVVGNLSLRLDKILAVSDCAGHCRSRFASQRVWAPPWGQCWSAQPRSSSRRAAGARCLVIPSIL